MYSVTVTEIGEMVVPLLDEKMLILFGPTVPEEIKDICAVHDGVPSDEELLKFNGSISIDGALYTITEVGEAANSNFGGLGHLTILFGTAGELLPGSVRVNLNNTPALFTGSKIVFS